MQTVERMGSPVRMVKKKAVCRGEQGVYEEYDLYMYVHVQVVVSTPPKEKNNDLVISASLPLLL